MRWYRPGWLHNSACVPCCVICPFSSTRMRSACESVVTRWLMMRVVTSFCSWRRAARICASVSVSTALQESGIAYDPDDVVWFHTEDRKVKPALMAKEMVQSGQLPDGIVCYNDQIAVQVMEELEKMGVRIPDDISITGYDNSLYAQRGSGITTIAHPQEKLGEMAAELILEKINGVPEEESKVERLIYPELIIRGSCRKIL